MIEEISKFSSKDSKKNSKYKNILNELIGSDSPLKSKERNLELSESSKKYNLYFFIILCLFTTLLILARSFELQIIKGDENKALAENNRVRILNTLAERGVIYDRNNKIIVQNKPALGLEMNTNICRYIVGNSIEDCLNEANKVSNYIDIDYEKIRQDLESGKSSVLIAANLSKEEVLPIEANLDQFPSISVLVTPLRDYLFADAFAHLIGYVGLDDKSNTPLIVGKSGIERFYNSEISGISGKKIIQVDSRGTSFNVISEIPSVSGKNVTLGIDLDLQLKGYELLKEKVENDSSIVGGALVAQDPYTGEVLALVSYPSYDPNSLSDGTINDEELSKLNNDPSFPFFNRVISATYPPASTFKRAVASAALAENIISTNTTINDIGFIQIGSFIFRNWKLDGHGLVDLRRAIQVSNDTYFYAIGGGYGDIRGIGIDKLSVWLKKFGYASKTGIDLDGESAGFIPDSSYKDWYLGDTYISSIGQGDVLSTPLQVNHVTNYFANDGYLVRPKVLKYVEGADSFNVEIIDSNIVSPEIHDFIREAMLAASKPGGTGYPLFDFADRFTGVDVAGKTGTAEWGNPDDKLTHAWFTAFAPYDNPSISVTVFLEAGGGGASDAAPIVRDVLEAWFSKDENSSSNSILIRD